MSHDRDEGVDRLLRGAKYASRVERSPACLDAETLAAWFEGGLAGEARAQAEKHAASCARCQAMVAAMARTAGAGAAASGAGRASSSVVRWLPWFAPLAGAVAVAVIVWVAVLPQRPASPEMSTHLGGARPEAADSRKEAAAEPPPPVAAPAAESPVGGKLGQRTARDEVGRSARELAVPQEKPAEPPARDVATRAEAESTFRADQAAKPAAPMPPVPPLAEGLAEARKVDADRRPRALASESAAGLRQTVFVPTVRPDVSWLILNETVIQRTTDGGATWTRQHTAAAPLFAGSASSPEVAWVVGRAGTILITTDGTTWQPVPFPQQVDLVAVRATSADAATVTTADGRSFATVDRGATWR